MFHVFAVLSLFQISVLLVFVLGVGGLLRYVIVTHQGLFYTPFWQMCKPSNNHTDINFVGWYNHFKAFLTHFMS